MAEDGQSVPILLDLEVSCPIEGLKERIDGFASLSELAAGPPPLDERTLREFLSEQLRAGTVVWRREWSPLRWCDACDVPLLRDRCDACGSPAGDRIELKFPCNPRPVLPHDERVFRAVGLAWPVDHSWVINAYHRPDFAGWELIHHGVHVGDIVCPEGRDEPRLVPTDGSREPLRGSGRPRVTIGDVVAANRTHCEEREREAVEFIRGWCAGRGRTLVVASFSGGKDSAVLAHLCHRSGVRMRVVQIDTGIDPPGNHEYSERLLAEFTGLRLTRLSNGELFWRALEKLGPPAIDFQWCRTVLKNTTRYRSRTFRLLRLLGTAGKVLGLRAVFVDGPRRREEEWRIALKRVVPIPSAPIETVTIRPMLDFTDLDIWMYFHRHELPLNPTYVAGRHQRLLCMFCPDQSRHELEATRGSSPAAWARFEDALRVWRAALGFPEEWVRENLWTRAAPTSGRMRELAIPNRLERVAERLNSAVRLEPCARQGAGHVVRGRIVADFDPAGLARWLQPLGAVRSNAGRIAVEVRKPAVSIRVGASGEIAVSGRDPQAVTRVSDVARDWLASFLNCIGCGACRAVFPRVSLRGGRAVMRRRCRPSLDGVRTATLACPVNAAGVRACTRLRQDA